MLLQDWNRLFSQNLDVEFLFLQSFLDKVEWNFNKQQESNVFHSVSLIVHKMKSELWIISGNMAGCYFTNAAECYTIVLMWLGWKVSLFQYYNNCHLNAVQIFNMIEPQIKIGGLFLFSSKLLDGQNNIKQIIAEKCSGK